MARCPFAYAKGLVGGPDDMAPKPQDACALPRRLLMGRPKVSNLRDMQLKLNLTATEYECVVRRARAVGMRPTHFGRALVLSKDTAPAADPYKPSNVERLSYLRSAGSEITSIRWYDSPDHGSRSQKMAVNILAAKIAS